MDQSGLGACELCAVSLSCHMNTGKNQSNCTNCLKCLRMLLILEIVHKIPPLVNVACGYIPSGVILPNFTKIAFNIS